jgi:hypothetical protein
MSEFPNYVENFVNKSLESKMQKAQPSLVLSSVKKGND